MPNVLISITPQEKEKKAQMSKAVTQELSRISGIEPEHFVIMFNEMPKESIAVGGTLLSEILKD
jgi:4-oxalocrotonate tautomerase family enzyme